MKCPYDNKKCDWIAEPYPGNCEDCYRYFDGCRATGAMPEFNWLKRLMKKLFFALGLVFLMSCEEEPLPTASTFCYSCNKEVWSAASSYSFSVKICGVTDAQIQVIKENNTTGNQTAGSKMTCTKQ